MPGVPLIESVCNRFHGAEGVIPGRHTVTRIPVLEVDILL
jgi:hypothetical protein